MFRVTVPLCTAALAVWWAPTFAVALLQLGPSLAPEAGALLRMAGIRYRIRRAARLIDRGKGVEAERTLAAVRRDAEAMTPRSAQARP